MNRDYEPISSGNAAPPNRMRLTMIAIAVAIVCGIVAGGWIVTRFSKDTTSASAPSPATEAAVADRAAELDGRIAPDGTVKAPPATLAQQPEMATGTMTPETSRALASRVADLEDRLSRINVAAQAASGNAARAEGLLVAFAARRIIDKGVPLGYIEGQLRLRFADQPRAVATIIEAANQPVKLEDLRVELEDMSAVLLSGDADAGFWTNLKRELGELFVIREEGKPSPVPTQRLLRAKRSLDAGDVDKAIEEVEALPGKAAANDWLIKARRYAEARRALDIIEEAAILEPLRSGETTPGAVEPVAPTTTR